MLFGMFMLSEFLHSFTVSALTTTLFFGGWRGPGAASIPTLGVVYFMAKTFVVYFVVMWVRFTVPRIRIDQLMDFNWKLLVPVSLATVIVIPLLDKIARELGWYTVPDLAALQGMSVLESIQANLGRAGVLLVTNLIIGLATLILLGWAARRQRRAFEARLEEGETVAEPAPAGAGD